MVRCDNTNPCTDRNFYCDLATEYCTHCRSICHPSQGTSHYCKQECPNYGTKTTIPTIGTSTVLTTAILVTQGNAISDGPGNNIIFPTLLLVLFVLIILIMVIAVFLVVYKLKNRDQLHPKDFEQALIEFCCIACLKCKGNQNAEPPEQIRLSLVNIENQNLQDDPINIGESSGYRESVQEQCSDNTSRILPSGHSETSFNTNTSARYAQTLGEETKGDPAIVEHNKEHEPFISSLQENPGNKSKNINKSSNKLQLEQPLDLEKPKASSKSHTRSSTVPVQSSIQTQTDNPVSKSITVTTQTEEPYFDLDTFSSVQIEKLRDPTVDILRPREQQRPDTSAKKEKHLAEAMKSIVFKPEYENNIAGTGGIVQEAIETRDSPILERQNDEQTNLKALGGLTIPQQETTPLFPEGGTPTPVTAPARRVHPNRRIYEILKSIYWVQGYYSEGRSIEIYIDLEDISAEKALEELVRRTGENPEKFRILQNEPVQYQSMKFAAII